MEVLPMTKRILSAVLALCLVFGAVSVSAYAAQPALKFDENGEFNILHMCTCAQNYRSCQSEMCKHHFSKIRIHRLIFTVFNSY